MVPSVAEIVQVSGETAVSGRVINDDWARGQKNSLRLFRALLPPQSKLDRPVRAMHVAYHGACMPSVGFFQLKHEQRCWR